MKKIILLILLVAASIEHYGQGYFPLNSEKSGNITDLVLIYQGGTHRLDWTKDQLAPYVYRQKTDKSIEWLFDGFLFIEFKDNLGFEYAHGYHQKPASKEQWSWLLDRNFEKGKALYALNSLIDSLEKLGFSPNQKLKVVLTVPEPIIDHKFWGEINGKKLDFSKVEDRTEACKWFIDKALETWNKHSLKHLDLCGFYWVAEESTEAKDGLLAKVANYIEKQNKKFYWIPYWKAHGAGDWAKNKFSIAYQQPNHFFAPDIPDSRIDEACQFAKEHGMGMEMEFDESMENPENMKRYYAYINGFSKNGAMTNSAIAYYQGNCAILKCATSKEPAMLKAYEDLCNIISERHKKK